MMRRGDGDDWQIECGVTLLDELWRKWLKSAIHAYRLAARPGITFTPEQEAMIREMVASGDAVGAQVYIGETIND